jgi:DNA-binding response OmpR family regulator
MQSRPRILLIGLPEALGRQLSSELEARGCRCDQSRGLCDALFRVNWDPPAMVLVDDRDSSGVVEAIVETLLEETCDVPIVGVDANPAIDALARLASTTSERRSMTPVRREGPKPRVLLVDDDVDLRDVLHLHLEMSGFEVIEATDGMDALAAIERERPDVVLLDLMMPRLSGVGFLQRLGAQTANPPPIVIYSAYLDPRGRHYPNVSAVLRKPTPLPDLLAALESSVRSGAPPRVP